jgi:tetratricopeptide (TPR) repeat protein
MNGPADTTGGRRIGDGVSSPRAADGPNTGASGFAGRYRHPVVGREEERSLLNEALASLSAKSRSIALIGEPGIGKSRLAAALAQSAEDAQIKVCALFGDALKRTTPFAAFQNLVRAALPDDGERQGALERALSRSDLDDAGKAVVRTMLLPTASAADAQMRLNSTQIARALATAFAAALDAPTLVLVEDLHLIDSESLDALRLLGTAEACAPILLLCTARPEGARDAERIAETVIRLHPMPRSGMRALAQHLLTDAGIPPALIERAVARADGIPFVLEQIIQSVEGPGATTVDMLPQGVEDAIRARLNKLAPRTRAMIQALSILGEDVETDVARSALEPDPEEFRDGLHDLERLGFIYPPVGGSIRFRHAILAEACAKTVPDERRREIHEAAINAISEHYGDLSGQYERLAFHAEGAGDDAGALEFHWHAARRAFKSSANRSLNLIFERAMDCIARIGAPAEPRYVDFVLMACAMLLQAGEFAAVNAYLPRAMRLAREQNRPAKVCTALCHLAMLCWFEGRYTEGLKHAEDALHMARSLDSPPKIFAAQVMLTNILMGMGQVDRAIALERDLCALFPDDPAHPRLGAVGIPASLARAFLGWYEGYAGAYEESLANAERALAIAVRGKDVYSEILARLVLGRALLDLKRNADAAECLRVAIGLSERDGFDAVKPNVAGFLATALARNGEAQAGVRIAEECLDPETLLRTGVRERSNLYAGYGEALVAIGEYEKGLAAADKVLEIGREAQDRCIEVCGFGLRARLRATIDPLSPLIQADLDERDRLSAQYGIVASS